MRILLLAAFVALSHARPQGGLGKGEEVTVRFRSVNAPTALPQHLTLTLEHNRRDVELPASLNLMKNEKIDDVTFYVDDNPVEANFKNAAFYQDLTNHAVITAKVVRKAGKPIRVIRGSFIANDISYEIEPVAFEEAEHTPEEGPTDKSDDQKYYKATHITADEAQEQPTVHTDPPTNTDEDFTEHEHVVREVTDVSQHIDKRAPKIDDLTIVNATKRLANVQYDIEVYFVTDFEFYKDWQRVSGHNLETLKEFFAHQANGIDIVYKSFSKVGLTVNVWVQKVEITTRSSTKMPSDNSKIPGVTNKENRNKQSIDGTTALDNMEKMRTARGYSHLLPDHLMLWTGWDIEGSTVGYALIGGICKHRSGNSILENSGWNSWSVAAHELGHNIGMEHDGKNSNGCSDIGNIMSPQVALPTAENRGLIYKFSRCSLLQCKKVLEGKDDKGFQRNCLKTATCEAEFNVKPDKLPGEIDSLNKMCKWQFGDDAMISRSCRSDPPKPETCLSLVCKSGDFCKYGKSADGSPCGTNKHCIQYECVAKAVKPASVSKVCLTGDGNPTVPSGCKDTSDKCKIVKSNPFNCVSEKYWRGKCCKTCTLYGFSP